MNWTQQELATYRAIGDWEKLWEATIPLVKWKVGKMIRLGALPSSDEVGDEWLQEGMLLAGEAMRQWDPAKGAYSTYIVSTLNWGLRKALEKSRRGGLTARAGVPLQVYSLESERDDVPDSSATAGVDGDGFADEGTFGAGLTYAGVIGTHGVPTGHYDEDAVPEGFADPAVEAERIQLGEKLNQGLAGLSPDERHALLACQTETQAAYAERTNTPARTVHYRLARAKAKMAKFFNDGV